MIALAAPHRVLLCVLAALALALAACGSEDETTTTSNGTTTTGENGEKVEPPGVNESRESIDEAAKVLEKAATKNDCEALKEFVLASRQDTHATKRTCKLIAGRLKGASLEGADGFDGGGVIEFTRGARTVPALMLVDRDGRFKLLQLGTPSEQASLGTKVDKGFDDAAADVVKAVAKKDCKAFRKVSSQFFGPGSARLPDKQVCEYVKNGPIATVTAEDRSVKPKPLGGNEAYAFYGVGSKTRFVTLIMTRQTPEGVPPSLGDLPEDAAEHVFLNAVVTDVAPATEDGADDGESPEDGEPPEDSAGGE